MQEIAVAGQAEAGCDGSRKEDNCPHTTNVARVENDECRSQCQASVGCALSWPAERGKASGQVTATAALFHRITRVRTH